MKDVNCAYCMQGELVAKFAYPICKMDTGFLYVFKEQSHPGRLILAHDKHISEMIELTDEERNAFLPMWPRRQGRFIRCISPIR